MKIPTLNSLTALTLLFASSYKVSHADSKLAGSRPNIILVMTDDQGMGDLSCLGNSVLETLHIDKFYEQSTRFTEFHVSITDLYRSGI